MSRFIVVASTSDLRVYAFGTPTGLPFKSRTSAEQTAKRIEKRLENKINGAVAVPLTAFL